jgi:hypothetical protein
VCSGSAVTEGGSIGKKKSKTKISCQKKEKMKTNWGTGDLVLCLIRVQGIGSVGWLGYWRLGPSFGQGTGDWVRHLVRLLEIGSFGFEPAKVRAPR